MDKQDVRQLNGFALTKKKGKIILHSPRGTHMVLKPDEVSQVVKLLKNTEE